MTEEQRISRSTKKTPFALLCDGVFICPNCYRREYSVKDYDYLGDRNILFLASCPCGTNLQYIRSIEDFTRNATEKE